MRLARLAVGVVLAALSASCKSEPRPHGPAATSDAPARTSAPPPPHASLVRPPETPRCRVIAARPYGALDASVASSSPPVGTALDGRDWLELGEHTELVLRHSATARELTLRGPGRFLPCFVGSETVLVATGTVVTTAGAGARAGAEVVLATPFGVVHFADAALELAVNERALDVHVTRGNVDLVPAASGDVGVDPVGVRLAPKAGRKLRGSADTRRLVERCAGAGRAIDQAPPSPAASAPSARALAKEWAVGQLRARQAARWACAMARAAAGRQDGQERRRLWDQIGEVDRVWRAPPSFAPDAGK